MIALIVVMTVTIVGDIIKRVLGDITDMTVHLHRKRAKLWMVRHSVQLQMDQEATMTHGLTKAYMYKFKVRYSKALRQLSDIERNVDLMSLKD